jgi:hypothetical protein
LFQLLAAAVIAYPQNNWNHSYPNSKESIIKVLLKYGAPTNLNTQTMQRWSDYPLFYTPLGFAIRDKNDAIVKLLLDHGANPNQRDNERYTPLYRAAMERNNAAIIRLLIQRGANVDAKTDPMRSYEVGLTPLHIAVNRNSIENVRALVDTGRAKVNVKSSIGNTPLHVAAEDAEHTIVQFLIDRGAHVNVKNSRGWTPLHVAAFSGRTNVVKILLDNGAIPFTQDSSGDTPSNLAKDFKYINIERVLRTWPGERSALRRMATASMNSVRNRNTGNRLHVPENVKQRILSKTGLFNRNQYGRPTTKNMSDAEIRNAWKKEQTRKRKRNENQRR